MSKLTPSDPTTNVTTPSDLTTSMSTSYKSTSTSTPILNDLTMSAVLSDGFWWCLQRKELWAMVQVSIDVAC